MYINAVPEIFPTSRGIPSVWFRESAGVCMFTDCARPLPSVAPSGDFIVFVSDTGLVGQNDPWQRTMLA